MSAEIEDAGFSPANLYAISSERLLGSDHEFLKAALAQQIKAKAVVDFTLAQLGVRYKLAEGDEITPDGVIIRKQ